MIRGSLAMAANRLLHLRLATPLRPHVGVQIVGARYVHKCYLRNNPAAALRTRDNTIDLSIHLTGPCGHQAGGCPSNS